MSLSTNKSVQKEYLCTVAIFPVSPRRLLQRFAEIYEEWISVKMIGTCNLLAFERNGIWRL